MKQYKLTGDDVMHYHSHKEFIKGGFKIAFFCALLTSCIGLFVFFRWMIEIAERKL